MSFRPVLVYIRPFSNHASLRAVLLVLPTYPLPSRSRLRKGGNCASTGGEGDWLLVGTTWDAQQAQAPACCGGPSRQRRDSDRGLVDRFWPYLHTTNSSPILLALQMGQVL